MTTKSFLRRSSLECLEGRRMLAGDFAAGDANQDYYFDEADFVQVSKAAKLETGEEATWQEGDWTGDGQYTSSDLVAAFVTNKYRAGAYDEDAGDPVNELAPFATTGEADVTVYYASTTGNVSVAATAGEITAIHLSSPSAILFSGQRWRGLFDVHAPHSDFIFEPAGEPVLHFTRALETGLSEQQILDELQVDGAKLGGGGLGTVRLAVVDTIPQELEAPSVQDLNYNFVDIDEATGVLYYDPDNGDITISGMALWISSIELISESGIFVGTETANYKAGLFDVANTTKFYRAHPPGIDTLHLPGIAQTGLSAEELTGDLTINGTIRTGGRLVLALSMPNGPNAGFVAPEPTPHGQAPDKPNDVPPSPAFGFVDIAAANGILSYDTASGDIVITAIANPITTVHLISQSSAFVGTETTDYTVDLFDVAKPQKYFRQNPAGLDTIELPGIARTGMTMDEVKADISFEGSVLSDGRLKLALATPALAATIAGCQTRLDHGDLVGDANLDGVFDSQDLVHVFQAGEYDDNIDGNSDWSDGDWNCDGDFDSSDFVAAFQEDTFALAAAAVAMTNAGDRRSTTLSDSIVADEVEATDEALVTRRRLTQIDSGNAGTESMFQRHEIQKWAAFVTVVDEVMENIS